MRGAAKRESANPKAEWDVKSRTVETRTSSLTGTLFWNQCSLVQAGGVQQASNTELYLDWLFILGGTSLYFDNKDKKR